MAKKDAIKREQNGTGSGKRCNDYGKEDREEDAGAATGGADGD